MWRKMLLWLNNKLDKYLYPNGMPIPVQLYNWHHFQEFLMIMSGTGITIEYINDRTIEKEREFELVEF